jgi:hypothetical protein
VFSDNQHSTSQGTTVNFGAHFPIEGDEGVRSSLAHKCGFCAQIRPCRNMTLPHSVRDVLSSSSKMAHTTC